MVEQTPHQPTPQEIAREAIRKARSDSVGPPCEICPKNFILIICAPGIYDTADPAHDRTWQSYYLAAREALEKDPPEKNETLWVFFDSTKYDQRWKDDDRYFSSSLIDQYDQLRRNRHARNNSQGYTATITSGLTAVAKKYGTKIQFRYVTNKFDIINTGNGFQDDSITRLWFVGHAIPGQLWLWIRHNEHMPVGPPENLKIYNVNLETFNVKKIYINSRKLSRFIGCNTATTTLKAPISSAETWSKHTGLKSIGYNVTIDFASYTDFANPPESQPFSHEQFSVDPSEAR